MSDYDVKERVKQAIDIVDLVGSYVQLRREGRAFKALCPWHDDQRPSLTVNPERQSFKCWVCDIGGDVFSFVMQMEGVEFRQALAMLAERAGIALQPKRQEAGPTNPVDDKQAQYRALDWAVGRLHHFLLHDAEADVARRYLAERGISAESVARFKLGFAPNQWEWLSGQARATPYPVALLERVGLVGQRRSGSGYYDRFKGRALFPIFDSQGRAVGLGGRAMPGLAEPDAAKYINSPETPLFSKSQQLYGLNLARDAIRRSGTALVMEGYTDVIMAHQFGFAQAVAVLGTALGGSHLRLLRRMADRVKIVLVLDGDEAGRRRANEILELFVSENADVRVLTLPDELDPCEFLLQRGAEAFRALVEGAVDALAHAQQVATAGIELRSDLQAASEALERLLATIARSPRLRADTTEEDRLRIDLFLARLAKTFERPEDQLRRRLGELRKAVPARPERAAAAPERERWSLESADAWEVWLLECLVQAPQLAAELPDEIAASLAFEPGRRIVSRVRHLLQSGAALDFSRLLLEFDDPAVKNLLVELDHRAAGKPYSAEHWSKLLYKRKEQLLERRLADLKAGRISDEEGLRVTSELTRLRQGISAPTEGKDA